MASEANYDKITGDYQYTALYNGPLCQRRWHREKLLLLERILAGMNPKSVCDVGCGSGIVTQHVAEICPESNVHGIDNNDESIRFAQQQYQGRNNLTFSASDILAFPGNRGDAFDFVYATEVIEHFCEEDVRKFLLTLKALGGPGTKFMVTTPDYHSLWPLLEFSLDLLHLTPRLRGHQHLIRFDQKKLSNMINSAGFRVTDIFSFCGISPFLVYLSEALSDHMADLEHRHGKGFLTCCLFEIENPYKVTTTNGI